MPASFKVESPQNREQYLHADFGDKAIGRITSIDSCLWWIILLLTYIKATGDLDLAKKDSFQDSLVFILEICLGSQFKMIPTLLFADGACTIDRPMGLSGHSLKIQSLFCSARRPRNVAREY